MASTIRNINEEYYCLKGHELELIKSTNHDYNNKSNSYFKCDGCKERGFGVRYSCDICNYDLHKECYRPSLIIQNPHFPGHNFDFLRHLPSSSKSQTRFCDACGKQILGFVYHCKDRGLDLHPCCNNLHLKIRFTDTEVILQADENMHDEDGGKRKSKACFRCKKTILIGPGTNKRVPGWSYVSTCGAKYWCHVYCMREMVMEIRRSLQTARLTAAPLSRRSGTMMISRSSAGEESWWEPLSVASTLTGFILGDPTAMLTAAFIEMFTG
ncbi:uncharacterized protein LOC124929667 [Impatiens glandulifera]|uniref:uncharacterized protein LOC124929667 n=1 Tax=Impatiens glandulifera TaxID=253017 RepID=UPI001FB0C92F|nr:uncharacterized protein LOC124929667 [Impatiens glandulifera]